MNAIHVINELNATVLPNQGLRADLKGAIDQDSAKRVSTIWKLGAEKRPLENGELPLHYALRTGKTNAAAEMLKQTPNIDLTEKDISGLTPWDHAAISGNKDSLFVLLGHKLGNLLSRIKSIFGTPLSYMQSIRIAEIMSKAQRDYTKNLREPLHRAAATGNLEALSKLCKDASDANRQTEEGFSPLHYAALSGDVKAMEFLIQKGASIHLLSKERLSALHMAAIGDSRAATEYLIKKGLLVHAIDEDGLTPLHYAMCKEGLNTAATLIEAGAPIYSLDIGGIDPLIGLVNVIKRRSEARDPLSLSLGDKLFFSGVMLSHLGSYAQMPILSSISNFYLNNAIFSSGMKQSWNAWAACFGLTMFNTAISSLLGIDNTPTILSWAATQANSAWRAWSVFSVAKDAAYGIAKTYKETKYETLRPIRNAIIHVINGTSTLHNYLRNPAPHQGNRTQETADVCSSFKTKDECILAGKLDPTDTSHAAWILGVDSETDCKDVHKAYRNMAKLKHPDKCDVSMKEKCTKIFQNIRRSYETLCPQKTRA